jgi:hypothetical protein
MHFYTNGASSVSISLLSISKFLTRLCQRPEVLARLNSGRAERIELLTVQSGMNFDECFLRRVEGVIDGVATSIISLADLKVIKREGARQQDLIDLASLP